MVSHGDQPFEEFIGSRTGADVVERRWLRESIESALEPETCRFVLVTGEPGAGKTSLLSGLAMEHPDWLRYFVDQNDGISHTTGDVTSFLLSTGHQLARRWPEAFDMQRLEVIVRQRVESVDPSGTVVGIRISDLTVSPFLRTATLEVEQRAGRVAGSLTGVEIGSVHLEPRLQDPVNLIHLALIDPAQVLLEKNPNARIVILLDALDSATRSGTGDALLDLLSGREAVELPTNVRVIITSRPEKALGLLRTGRRRHLTEVPMDPTVRRVGADLTTYARRALAAPGVERAVRDEGMMPDQFHRRIALHASGNFQYLASYARALNDALAEGNDDLVSKLLKLDSFPSDLDGIYAFFAEIARADIERLHELEIQHPLSESDRVTPAWEGVGQPLLGTLTVAREPLSIDQLIQLSGIRVWRRLVRAVLSKLPWLLDTRDDKVAFYHASICEFLASDRAARDCPDSWVDETEWHERITRHYKGAADTWAEVDWEVIDRYGLEYIAHHVERSRPNAVDDLIGLVCPGLLRAIRGRFGSERRFLELVDRAAARLTARVAQDEDAAKALPQVMYLSVVRSQASRTSNVVPPKVLGLLARQGRLREGLDRAAAIPPSLRQFAAMLEILRYATPGPGDPSTDDLLEMTVEAALAFDQSSSDIHHGTWSSRSWFALQAAARLVAPYDVERALRLWRHGQESRNGPGTSDEAPDVIYEVAAKAETDIGRARALLDSIRGNRIAAYAELAKRADPAQAAEILESAEADLPRLEAGQRLRGLSRLAVAWEKFDAAETARLLAQMRAEAFNAVNDEEFADHMVAAAAVVASTDEATARMLLAGLDTIEPGGHGLSGLLRGIELWRQLGESGRAEALSRRRQRFWAPKTRTWTGLRLRLAALDTLEDAEALRRIEELYAEIPSADEAYGHLESLERNGSLVSIYQAFALYDTDRAADVAREISRVSWSGDTTISSELDAEGFPTFGGIGDRYSALAEIAHQCLDRDDKDGAERLLDEITRYAQGDASPETLDDDSVLYVPASDPGPDLTGEKSWQWVLRAEQPIDKSRPIRKASLDGLSMIFNLSNSWAKRVNQQFFREPADMVRSVDRGPHSLARLVRVIAEKRAGQSLSHATALTRTVVDPAERTIGFAALHRAAHPDDNEHGPGAEALSQELDRALACMETHRWIFDADAADPREWAYLRPDHRARFEVAVRSLGCRAQDKEALDGLTMLENAIAAGIISWASRLYASTMIAGRQPHREFRQTHETTLRMNDNGDVMLAIAIAQAAYQEFRIRVAIPGYRSAVVQPRISDTRYAAVVDLVTPGPGEPLSTRFIAKIEGMIEKGTFPAVGELVAFATEARPEYVPDLRGLAEQIIAAAKSAAPALGVETLSVLAGCPALQGLRGLEPVQVLRQAERCTPDRHDLYHGLGDAQARLFPALLARHPDIAIAKLYQVGWGFSMELLESAVSAPAAEFGADLAGPLASSIQRGLRCVARDGSIPDTFDGVDIEQLASLPPGRGWGYQL